MKVDHTLWTNTKEDVWETSGWNLISTSISVCCSTGRVCKHNTAVLCKSFVCGFSTEFRTRATWSSITHFKLPCSTLQLLYQRKLDTVNNIFLFLLNEMWNSGIVLRAPSSLFSLLLYPPARSFTLLLFFFSFSHIRRHQRNVQVLVCFMRSCPRFSSPPLPSWWKPSRESTP